MCFTVRTEGNLLYFPLLACNSSYANLTQDAPTAFLLWPAHYICGFSFRSFVSVRSAVTHVFVAASSWPWQCVRSSPTFSLSLSVQHAKPRWSVLSSVSGFYISFCFLCVDLYALLSSTERWNHSVFSGEGEEETARYANESCGGSEKSWGVQNKINK